MNHVREDRSLLVRVCDPTDWDLSQDDTPIIGMSQRGQEGSKFSQHGRIWPLMCGRRENRADHFMFGMMYVVLGWNHPDIGIIPA